MQNEPYTAPEFVKNDGGRKAAGYKGKAGDCAARALAIAGELDYMEARRMIKQHQVESPDRGVLRPVMDKVMQDAGFSWTPCSFVGSGCQVHVCREELPATGRYILRLSKHYVALVDGVIHDTQDPARGGTRCVYGYWTKS
jgi:hypothetical protein